MAKRSSARPLSDQLNDAVEAIMTDRDAPQPRVHSKLAALLRIAADLRDLPREQFKARLKTDLQRSETVAAEVKPVPTGYHTATPCLVIREAAAGIEFYKKAFGATELLRFADPSGHIMHAEIQIGDSRIAIAEEALEWGNHSPQALGGSSVIMQVYVDDVDGLAAQAVAAGARVLFPVADQFYGDRSGRLADPFGHIWIVATHTEDVSPEEMQRRAEAWTSERTASSAPQEDMPPAVKPIPKGIRTMTPYLQVDGADKLIDFLKRSFGAEEVFRAAQPDGRIKHAEVKIEDSVVELSDTTPEYPANPTAIHLYVKNSEATYKRALRAGATSMHELTDQDYGDREASIKDPFGNHWYIATPLKKSKAAPTHVPEGLRNVMPYLHPRGAPQLIDFLKQAFGAEEVFRAQAEGIVHHAKIRIGDAILEMGEAHGPYQPMTPALHLHVDDTDSVYQRALQAGASSVLEPTDRPWGQRSAGVKDTFGNLWWIAAPLEESAKRDVAASDETIGAAESIPAGYHTVTPYLTVQGAPQLLDFLKAAFGATEVMRTGDPSGHFHGEARIGDSLLMMGNAGFGMSESSAWNYVYVKDVDAAYKRALKLGATSLEAPVDLPYGDRRATVKDAFGTTWGIAAPLKGESVPERFRAVTPYLGGHGAPGLIDFLKQAFGATVLTQSGDPAGDEFHAELTIGDSLVMVGGAPETSHHIYLYVHDVDATYNRALQAGATSISAPTDQDYGDRNAFVKDPFGNIWFIATHKKDVVH